MNTEDKQKKIMECIKFLAKNAAVLDVEFDVTDLFDIQEAITAAVRKIERERHATRVRDRIAANAHVYQKTKTPVIISLEGEVAYQNYAIAREMAAFEINDMRAKAINKIKHLLANDPSARVLIAYHGREQKEAYMNALQGIDVAVPSFEFGKNNKAYVSNNNSLNENAQVMLLPSVALDEFDYDLSEMKTGGRNKKVFAFMRKHINIAVVCNHSDYRFRDMDVSNVIEIDKHEVEKRFINEINALNVTAADIKFKKPVAVMENSYV